MVINIKAKCLNCSDYKYVTNKNRKQVCYQCDIKDATDELRQVFKEAWMYKAVIRLLDWFEARIENILS